MIGIPNFDPRPHLEPRKIPPMLLNVAVGLVVLGVAALGAGLFMGEEQVLRTKAAILVNLNYFTGLSFGAAAFLVAQTLTRARWSRPLRRYTEGIFMFAPVILAIWLVFMLSGGLELYEWYRDPSSVHGHKVHWLQAPFFLGRNMLFMSVIVVLGMALIRAGLRPDLALAKQKLGDAAPSWWGGIIAGFGDTKAEEEASFEKQTFLAPFLGISYALGMTFYSFDTIMSLSHHWYANMFGGWFFMSSMWTCMIWMGLLSLGTRKALGIEGLLKPAVYHDLGKMIFGFSMVWAYMFFAHLQPIWYGNMTEEIGYMLVRLSLEPWTYLVRIVGVLCFLFPFGTLLSRGLKKMPAGLFLVLGIVATGIWLERFTVAVPSIWMKDTLPLGPIEIGISLGFLGLFLNVVGRYIAMVPPVPVADPLMLPHPDDLHVHGADHHGHGDHGGHDHAHGH